MKQSKLSFMKFFPADWFSDPDLRKCSLEAKGLLIDLLCLMWKSETRGKLSGTYEQLSRQIGQPMEKFVLILSELVLNNVLELNDSADIKTIFSRRLVREQKLYNNKTLRNQEYYLSHKSVNIKSNKSNDSVSKMSDVRCQMSDNIPKNALIEAERIINYFLDNRIIEKDIDSKEFKKWVNEIYKLVRIDKEDWSEIDRVIRLVLADDFWKTVVHSPLKFRRKDKEGIRYWDKFKQLSKQNSKARTQIEGETDYNKGNML